MKRLADGHIHATTLEPEKVSKLLDTMAGVGVTNTTILSLCAYKGHEIAENISHLWWKSKYDKMCLKVYGSVHEFDLYASIPYEVQAEKLLALGCDGFKFIHMKPDARKDLGKGVNHPSYDKMFSLCEERGIPVLLHSGDPENFWGSGESQTEEEKAAGWTYDNSFLSCEGHYDEVFEMLDKHPKLNLTIAHFFFLSNQRERAAAIFEKYPNVKFDLTPGWEMYVNFSKDIDAWHDFFEKYSDRILFGTDSGDYKSNAADLNKLVYSAITHDTTEFPMPAFPGKVIKGLGLSQEAVDNICYNNYVKYTGEEPVPVDMAEVRKCAEKMYADIKGIEQYKKSEVFLENLLKEI